MLNYTKDFMSVLKRDLFKLMIVVEIINVFITFLFPIYQIIKNLGSTLTNTIMLVATLVAYFSCLACEIYKKNNGETNKAFEAINRTLKFLKRTIFLFFSIYAIYTAGQNSNGLSVIIGIFMIVSWVISLVVDILNMYLPKRFALFKECIKEDLIPTSETGEFLYNYADDILKLEKVDVNQEHLDKMRDLALKEDRKKETSTKDPLEYLDYEEYVKDIDKDNDGNISFNEVIKKALKEKSLRVDKGNYFHRSEINKLVDDYHEYLKKGPNKKTITVEKLNNYIISKLDNDKFILKNKEIINNYIIKENNGSLTEDEKIDAITSIYKLIPTMQKILYLYGYVQVDYINLCDVNYDSLLLALKYILYRDNIDEISKELLKVKKNDKGVIHKLGVTFVKEVADNYIANPVKNIVSTGKEKVVGLKDKLFHKKDKTKEIETTNQELLK